VIADATPRLNAAIRQAQRLSNLTGKGWAVYASGTGKLILVSEGNAPAGELLGTVIPAVRS
jgi:hypothetical protein